MHHPKESAPYCLITNTTFNSFQTALLCYHFTRNSWNFVIMAEEFLYKQRILLGQ